MNYVLVISTIDKIDSAKKIAKTLIEEKLAACVNIVPNVTSIYKWKGEICEDAEYLLFIKSASEKLDTLKKEIKNLHTYEVPEIVVLDIADGDKNYLDWIDKTLL